jgi:hypothetical protein
VVECDLAKVEVAGSTPVSRSIKFSAIAPRNHGEGLCCKGPNQIGFKIKARYPSGKGEVCKTFMRRFDSDPRLQHFNPLNILENLRILTACHLETTGTWSLRLESLTLAGRRASPALDPIRSPLLKA